MTANLILNCIKGNGRIPTICLPGFVPKSREAFHKQIGMLREFGDVWLVDYPDDTFNLDKAVTQLAETAGRMAQRGTPPVIVSVSFGSALAVQLLQKKPGLSIGGCILVSPMLGLNDIYCSDNDATFFGKLASTIINSREFGKDFEIKINKARKVFRRMLRAGKAWEVSDVPQSIIDEIDEALLTVQGKAVFDRLQAINEIDDLCGKSTITTAPTLILWAEEEEHVIRKHSSNFKLLTEQPKKPFPGGQSVVVKSGHPKQPLKHASLLAHSVYYNRYIKEFYLSLAGTGVCQLKPCVGTST